jgi:hypothetical protein
MAARKPVRLAPPPAFRHDSIPPQSNATCNSVAGGSAYSDRLLVLKGQNVLKFLLSGPAEFRLGRRGSEAARGKDGLGVEGGFEAAHEGEIERRSTPEVDGKSLAAVRDADNALPIGRGKEKRGVAPTRVGPVSWW